MTARFGAVLTAMVTPFDEEGRLDVDAAVALARWLVDNGNDGLVVTGTTGEATTLSDAEKAEVWRAVAEAVTVPVIAGASTNDTAHSLELVRTAEQCGVAAILSVTPYYSRPSQAGIDAHFRAVAGATSLPVLLYDIPVRTGRKIAHDTLVRLAREVPNIVAVKDAASDLNATAWLRREAPDDFEVYSGEDGITLPLLSVGAVGTISVASHWTAALQGEMLAAYFKGDVDTARRINARLLPSFRYETGDDAPNPIPSKAMLRTLGLRVGQCRMPMGPAPAGLEDRAREILADLGDDAPKPVNLG
ncbi:MAG TPA: 4-hydroxy-tetrahydrodipicolinate synthase [Acidimicrobiales bacterium]|nr:4-hydroxy-tetrahydrodipicolinate synthase [Acidimicrobiales bacterium]